MDDVSRGFQEGVKAARYFGAEFQANPGSHKVDYLNDAADYFCKGATIKDLSTSERKALYEAFNAGMKAESKLSNV
jgi:hypothetical protein